MEIVTFVGRLHPMVVHLPIGFLLIASVFDVMSYHRRYRHLRNAMALTLFASFVTAAVACVLGYVLSRDGSYDDDILESHRNAGIIVAVASGLWWVLVYTPFPTFIRVGPRNTTVFGFAVIIALCYTGHQGASLTHGSDYLSIAPPEKPKRPKPLTVSDAVVFSDVVLPILEHKCERCHKRGKRKGDLIVSTYADLMMGGENGEVVIAGNSENSELYRRITLDAEHKDFMPGDGRKPLTEGETKIIKWWIEEALLANEIKVASVAGHEEMIPVLASFLKLDETNGLTEGGVANIKQPNPDIPVSIDTGAVHHLRKNGVRVRVMLHSPVMLDITLPPQSGIAMNALEDGLRSVARNIVWLNLADNDIEVSELAVLKEMSNLEKLRLERNPVGDDLIDLLNELRHLESLNINDTKITEEGLVKLKAHPSLKRVFRWSSRPAAMQ